MNTKLSALAAQTSAEGVDQLYVVPSAGPDKKVQTAGLFNSAVATGTLANLPEPGFAGRLYFPTNSVYVYRDDGVAWSAFGPIMKLTPPPAVDTWTWVNQSSATADETNGGIYLESPAGPDQAMGLFRAVPAVPYTITTCIIPNLSDDSDFSVFGLGWRDSVGGRLVTFGVHTRAGGNAPRYIYLKWTAATSAPAEDYGNNVTCLPLRMPLFVRFSDDGGRFTVSVSSDGYKFNQRFRVNNNNWLANPADQLGFFVQPNGATSGLWLISWEVT